MASYSARVVACCLKILQRCEANHRDQGSRSLMVAEIDLIAAGLLALDFSTAEVESALVARDGPEVGQRLNGEFAAAFVAAWANMIQEVPDYRTLVAIMSRESNLPTERWDEPTDGFGLHGSQIALQDICDHFSVSVKTTTPE